MCDHQRSKSSRRSNRFTVLPPNEGPVEDMINTKTKVELKIDLSGVKPNDINLELNGNDGVLSLTALREPSCESSTTSSEGGGGDRIITKGRSRVEGMFSIDPSSIDRTRPIEATFSRERILNITIFKRLGSSTTPHDDDVDDDESLVGRREDMEGLQIVW
eukprot:CAMPEP_0194047006 /NCGR_PEP_ID=MMETSP0009_2-20130614/23374_1 /TAXON_ID=210454 /ORGANISM="Grammatophora oceanica, Strain CCMP 410" /LENGTH=160 /DNA_ID=CAMNT_0038692507 /DNA_START=137 /DNA_END=619 /DNA_ORIENTATION=+